MTMLWYAPVCANCSANTLSFGLWARPPTASRRSPTPRLRNQMSFSWTWLCLGRTALRRHARFTTGCQTSTSWGFQRTVTRPPSVQCVKPEHTRTSARRKVHVASSITCSHSAHRQRGLRELDPTIRILKPSEHLKYRLFQPLRSVYRRSRSWRPPEGPNRGWKSMGVDISVDLKEGVDQKGIPEKESTMKSVFQTVLLAGVFAAGAVSVKAQEVPRWELGPMFNLIKIQQFDSNRFFGFGARGVLNFSDVLGADVQFARNTHNESFARSNSRTTYSGDQFTVNLKATLRRRNLMRLSPFAIAGIGLARDGVSSTFQGPFPGSFNVYQNKFALRFGCGLEFSPNPRFSVRL